MGYIGDIPLNEVVIGDAPNGLNTIANGTSGYVLTSNGTGSTASSWQDKSVFQSGISTAPTDSHTATAAFGNTLTAGTAKQNTTGYDILVNIGVGVSSATTAQISMGIGPTSTPTTDPMTPPFTIAAQQAFVFTAIVPNNYYLLVATSGTITVTGIGLQVCPL